jgi:dienelactone hydrolase
VVSVRTEDGVTLAATLYETNRRPAPAVILLHMQTRSREDWQGVANLLSEAGIHALAIDFRSHGASGGGASSSGGDVEWPRLVLDVKAARAYLSGRADLVRPDAIGIAGASIGANVALLHAAGDPAVRSLALLSPGLDYRALRTEAAVKKYGARPVLLVAGSNDPYAIRSVKELASGGGGVRDVRMLENAGHGTSMLSRDPGLARALVDWFLRTLL